MFKRTFTTSLILGAAALAPPLHAQGVTPCFDRTKLIENLATGYNESLAGAGLRSSEQLVELWTSAETGTFTIFVTRPNGMSCVLTSGQNFHLMPAVEPKGEGVSWQQ